jgi:preprotein translocase SecE subunit
MKQPNNRSGKQPPPRTPATNAAAARQARGVSATAFVQGVYAEMKRVTWPTREEWVTATVLTIGLVVVVGLFTAACDHIFGWLIGFATGQSTR